MHVKILIIIKENCARMNYFQWTDISQDKREIWSILGSECPLRYFIIATEMKWPITPWVVSATSFQCIA